VADALLQPLAAALASARQACVADARLLLAPFGVLTVTRLAREFAVWIPRELREILRDTSRYMLDATCLVPRVYCAGLRALDPEQEAEEIRRELAQWDRLPEEEELAALPLYHLGDRADESHIPAGVDRGVRERCEQLQRGLDLVVQASRGRHPVSVAACVRDAASLCAALEPYSAFILTRLEPDGEGGPAICDYLDAWGVPVSEAPLRRVRTARALGDALARAGVGPLVWAGVELAAVHVVVPGFPVLGGADSSLDDDAVARLWSQASVFWHRV
jgi:hypothetical protein